MPQEAIDRNIERDLDRIARSGMLPEGEWAAPKVVLTWLRGNEMSMIADFFVDSITDGRFGQFYIDDRVHGAPQQSAFSRGKVTKRDVSKAVTHLHKVLR